MVLELYTTLNNKRLPVLESSGNYRRGAWLEEVGLWGQVVNVCVTSSFLSAMR